MAGGDSCLGAGGCGQGGNVNARKDDEGPACQKEEHAKQEMKVSGAAEDGENKGENAPAAHNPTQEERDAAISIQKTYRDHRTRRHRRGQRLTPNERWDDAIGEAMYRTRNKPISREQRERKLSALETTVTPATPVVEKGESRVDIDEKGRAAGVGWVPQERKRSLSPASKDRWARVGYIAKLVQQDDPESDASSGDSGDEEERGYSGDASSIAGTTGMSSSSSGGSETDRTSQASKMEERRKRKQKIREKKMERVKNAKAMDMQYFLELVDLKHRYGANLKVYHDHWQKESTQENFFYWWVHTSFWPPGYYAYLSTTIGSITAKELRLTLQLAPVPSLTARE